MCAVQVMRQLLGHEPLPWEEGAQGGGAAAARSALGALHAPVLQLLQRDPVRRMPVSAFASICRRLSRD